MSDPVNRVPEGAHSVSPHLTVREGAKMIEFYTKALGAQEVRRSLAKDGKSLLHAELKIGDSKIYLNDEVAHINSLCPQSRGGTSVVIHLFVEDVDSHYKRALDSCATVVMPLADQFWGDRYGVIEDPCGHRWSMTTHVKDLTPDEMQRAAAEAFGDKH
jgi:PhnB protein